MDRVHQKALQEAVGIEAQLRRWSCHEKRVDKKERKEKRRVGERTCGEIEHEKGAELTS